MDSEQSTSLKFDPYFKAFFKNSVNVISSSSNSGKTTALLNFINHRDIFFAQNFEKLIVVLCNNRVENTVYQDLENDSLQVDVYYLDEFLPDEQITENCCLVFDDVNHITEEINTIVRVSSHHLNLNSVFLLTQSVLAETDFKILLSLAHTILVFNTGVQGAIIGKYIKKYFFINRELKDYFDQILSFAELRKLTVLIQLNQIAGNSKAYYLAIVGLENLFKPNMKETVVFPQLNRQESYEKSFDDYHVEIEHFDASKLPKNSYILVKAENVKNKTSLLKKNSDETDCEKVWNSVIQRISEDIESSLKFNKQMNAKNIVRYILGSKEFCISKNAKTIMLKHQPKTSSSLLDYLNVATRPSGPSEIPDPNFLNFTRTLLQSNVPRFYFKNKSLLNTPTTKVKSKAKK